MRIGNIDFKADAAIVYRMSCRHNATFNWSHTRVPWVQYLGQTVVNPNRAKDIVSLAALTSRCRATDPRDRIFAIVQLLVDAWQRETLAPDYTLSFQHFFIGFFAHSLLVARKTFFLDFVGIQKFVSHTIMDTLVSTAYVFGAELITCYDYNRSYIAPAVDAATGALHIAAGDHLFVLPMNEKIETQARFGLCAPFPAIQTWSASTNFNGSDWPAVRNLRFLRLSEVVLNILKDARAVVFSEEQMRYIKNLPNGHDALSRRFASDICDAFYQDSIHYLQDGSWGRLGALLLDSPIFKNREYLKRGPLLIPAMRDFMTRNNFMMLLEALSNAYSPPMDMHEVVWLIKNGPTDAQKTMGVPKYINGIQVDGSVMRVLIV
ncbi:hypothetical protein EK21DRAFT_88564 [Setomelanomma holmii]|uniref:Uncharacterized protein n=1 Tax=Setomelanomma holmii TaxID=210430 RepID=A0A9P4LKX0_9PLEO|nr:hypothetical protein EK21DRAFT_88564 [Setomelanomma holmii]